MNEKKYSKILKSISGEKLSVRRFSYDDYRLFLWVPNSVEILGRKRIKVESDFSSLTSKYVKIFDNLEDYKNYVTCYRMIF